MNNSPRSRASIRSTARRATEIPRTSVWIGDTHLGSDNIEFGDANDRQIVALNSLANVPFPTGGLVGVISEGFHVGDIRHNDFGNLDRARAMFQANGLGSLPFPIHKVRGNHDEDDVAAWIVEDQGSLTWGGKFGPIYIQAFTENYTSPISNAPPSAAQIAEVEALLALRPANEPTILFVHRALSGGYPAEWATDALDALVRLAARRKVIALIHGHDHASGRYTYSRTVAGVNYSIRCFTPGSVTMAPFSNQLPPYTVIYPEAVLVMRTYSDRIEIGSYLWGYNTSRVLAPGWEWTEEIRF